MEDALWKILATILIVILMFVFPTMNMLDRQDDVSYNVVYTETFSFVDKVRSLGYMTEKMYEDFNDKLMLTGNLYDIELEHQIKSSFPDLFDPTGGNYLADYDGSYTYDIINSLYKNNIYKFGKGDYFSVEVKNKGKTKSTALKDMILFRNTEYPTIRVRSGGMVGNEGY